MLAAYNVNDTVLCSNHVALLQSPFEGTSAPTAQPSKPSHADTMSGVGHSGILQQQCCGAF